MGASYVNIDAAEIIIDKPFVCKVLSYARTIYIKTHIALIEIVVQTSKACTFDITKFDVIFGQLLEAKIIKLCPGDVIPKAKYLKGKVSCTFYNSNKYATNNCIVFRNVIKDLIDKGKLKFSEKAHIVVDTNHFPLTNVNMVNACIPK